MVVPTYAHTTLDVGGCIMELLAGACRDGTCPAVYLTERGTLVVQGPPVDGAPEGEARVELSPDLLKQALERL
jgi:hypothetical protein